MSGRVLHFGPYEGEEIDTVVEMDPEYILWASANEPEHQIGQVAVDRARQLLDEPRMWLDSDGDDLEEEIQMMTFGRTRFECE